ncbi:MAG: response regulator transcription factor [Phycisphaeraceae bacterium]|nr:response regulator transcription factor [Phycisphaeraceae bacterium]
MTHTTTVMALDALWPVGRALARVFQRNESISWAGLAIDTPSWREMLIAAQPDIALIDPLGFRETTHQLVKLTRAVSPDTRIVLFVPTIAEPVVQRWYDAGADACVAKWMHPDLILDVVAQVRRGTFRRDEFWELISANLAAAS